MITLKFTNVYYSLYSTFRYTTLLMFTLIHCTHKKNPISQFWHWTWSNWYRDTPKSSTPSRLFSSVLR